MAFRRGDRAAWAVVGAAWRPLLRLSWWSGAPLAAAGARLGAGAGGGGGAVQSPSAPPTQVRAFGGWSGGGDAGDDQRALTPWVRSVISGVDLLRNPKYNKGLAFSEQERDKLFLRGLLPAGSMSQEAQVERVMANVRELKSPLERYRHLTALQERNERLFFRVLTQHPEEVKPIIYAPTVGRAAQAYGLLFRRPRGLFISMSDRGRVYSLLKNWPERRVTTIVLTDGERVMGLGDLGVQAMSVAVSKCALYTAFGGIDPAETLPVCIDVGTDNEALLDDPFYVGLRHQRVRGEAYDELVDEFIQGAKRRWGPNTMIQFEDFSNANGLRLLNQYRGEALCFHDDINGTAASTLAGLLAALRVTDGTLEEQRVLIAGAGETGCGIAELLAEAIAKARGVTPLEAREQIWLVDSEGLVVRSRGETLALHKLPWAHEGPECTDLLGAVRHVRPTALLGVRRHRRSFASGVLASGETGGANRLFTREVLQEMASLNARPIVFAMSRPAENSECTAEEAYQWTDGRVVFTSGCPFDPFTLPDGRTVNPVSATSSYIFPGIGLGCMVSGATRLRSDMFLAAAEALSRCVTDEQIERGALYPPVSELREVGVQVGRAVASKVYELKLNSLPPPQRSFDLDGHVRSWRYDPSYRPYN